MTPNPLPDITTRGDCRFSSAKHLRRLLSMLVAVVLTLAAVAIVQPHRAYAAVGDYTPANWNMQGSSGGKWTTVGGIVAGSSQYSSHSVVALQEAGPSSSLPTTAVTGRFWNFLGRAGQQYTVREYVWRTGTARSGMEVYLYFMRTDFGGNRVNLATVSHTIATNVLFVPDQFDGTRPMFGIVTDNTPIGLPPSPTVFWNIHASARGGGDVNGLLAGAANVSAAAGYTEWAVLGDFNRDPSTITLPAGSVRHRTYAATQASQGELDYMVAHGTNVNAWAGRRIPAMSDHFAVEYGMYGSAENHVRLAQDRDRCMAWADDSSSYSAFWNPCVEEGNNAWGHERYQLQGSELRDMAHGYTNYCLDARGEGTRNGTQVGMYPCNGQANQTWVWKPNGNLYNPVSGRCLDSTAGGFANFVLYDCNTVTLPDNQRFLLW